jgi:hypothetical protein
VLKGQGRSFEASWKSVTFEHYQVEVEKHLDGLHRGFACTSCGYNSIWLIVDRLTKSAHFIPVSTIYRVRQYAEFYLSYIVRYHGIPKIIISDRGSIFVARFWEQLHDYLGTHLIPSSTYHLQTDGQIE